MVWIVETELLIPRVQTAIGENGGSPAKIQLESAIVSSDTSITINDFVFSLHDWPEEKNATENVNNLSVYESVLIRSVSTIDDKDTMFSQLGEELGRLYERLTFLLQSPVYARQVWVTNPDGTTEAHSSDFMFNLSNPIDNTVPMEIGGESNWLDITLLSLDTDEKINHALFWYRKGIGERKLNEKFIFLWIALEIMSNRLGDNVTYTTSCEECGHETTQIGIGQTLRAFLVSQTGISEQLAKDMWRARQMVHGQSLRRTIAQRLGELTGHLHNCITDILKQEIGLDSTQRPLPPKQVMFFGGNWIHRGQ